MKSGIRVCRSALACSGHPAVPGMSLHWPQVFGEVTKGMDVVKTVESYGSQSGARFEGVQHDLVSSLISTVHLNHDA